MGEDDAGFRGYYRIEASFVPLAAEQLFGGFLGVADIAPLGAGPMLITYDVGGCTQGLRAIRRLKKMS